MSETAQQIFDNWMDPNYKFFVNREEDRTKFMLEQNRMKEEYLGACLDYISLGSINTVMYEFSVKGLIGFIQEWMRLNKDNLIWSDEKLPKDFKLPYIHYSSCPREAKHKNVIRDLGGRLRCSNIEIKKFKPSFISDFTSFDEFSMTERIGYCEHPPHDHIPDCAWNEKTGKLDPSYAKQYEDYLEQNEIYEHEEPTLEVTDLCYAIISDQGIILPLEKILDRLNIAPKNERIYCPGYSGCTKEGLSKLSEEEKEWHSNICPWHDEPTNQSVFPFDGWTLAWYVEKWYNQVKDGKAPISNKPNEMDTFKKYKNFQVIESEE